MKLFSLPDGTVDRKDRAQWLTPIFDLAFQTSLQITAVIGGWFIPGSTSGGIHAAGPAAVQRFAAGSVAGGRFQPGAIASSSFAAGSGIGQAQFETYIAVVCGWFAPGLVAGDFHAAGEVAGGGFAAGHRTAEQFQAGAIKADSFVAGSTTGEAGT